MNTVSPLPVATKPLPMRDALLQRIYENMATDKDIFFVTADFGSPVLDKIRGDYPDRFINVGIAEQNLINVSAGLALEGYKVFAYAIAPFITMRCYEQIRVSLAILSQVRPMNVTLIGVGAGYSYVVSGPTHQCFEDLSLMRALPSLSVHSPADHVTAAAQFESCLAFKGCSYLRLDAQVLPIIYEQAPDLKRGFHVHREGQGIVLLATGYMVHTAKQVAEKLAQTGIDAGVIDLFELTQFDEKAMLAALAPYDGIVTLEEGFRGRGGMDSMMFDFAVRHDLSAKINNIGVKPAYQFELGTRASLHEHIGIGVEAVCQTVTNFAGKLARPAPAQKRN